MVVARSAVSLNDVFTILDVLSDLVVVHDLVVGFSEVASSLYNIRMVHSVHHLSLVDQRSGLLSAHVVV